MSGNRSRKESVRGIYHVMLRGINRQVIFEDDEDRAKFLWTVQHYKKLCGFEVPAYCLMSNHVHLMIKTSDPDIGKIFRRIGPVYVRYFNKKYGRTGPLFQTPARSEPLETDERLLSAFRYISRNPVKAGICSKPEDYSFSSWLRYSVPNLFGPPVGPLMSDYACIYSIMNPLELISYVNTESDEEFIDTDDIYPCRIDDSEARKLIIANTGCKCVSDFQHFDSETRDAELARLVENGLGIRQITRLTGAASGIIARAVAS